MSTPKFFYDGAYLEEKEIATSEDECILLVVSPVAFYLIADMSRMLLWETRYKSGYIPQVAKEAYQQMNTPQCLDVTVNADMSGIAEAIAAMIAANQELINAIIENGGNSEGSEEMNQTVTVNCGGGCGGCGSGSGSEPDYKIPLPETPPVTPPENGEPPVNQSKSQKCSVANYLVYSLRLTLLKMMENGGDFVTFTAWWSGLFESVDGFAYALAYQVWQWCKQTLTGQTTDLNDIFDQYYNLYVCNLFSTENETEAHSALMGSLYETLKAYPDVSYVSRLIANELPYGLLFKNDGEIEIPLGFENRECCGESQGGLTPIPAPDEDSGFEYVWWIPQTSTVEFSSANKVQGVYDGDGKVTVTSVSESSYDHGIAYTFTGGIPGGSLVASEIETLGSHVTREWGASQIGSYAGNSTDGCLYDVMQRRIQISTGEWTANGYLRQWCESMYPGAVDTNAPSMSCAGWPSWIQPNASPMVFRVRYLYKVAL